MILSLRPVNIIGYVLCKLCPSLDFNLLRILPSLQLESQFKLSYVFAACTKSPLVCLGLDAGPFSGYQSPNSQNLRPSFLKSFAILDPIFTFILTKVSITDNGCKSEQELPSDLNGTKACLTKSNMKTPCTCNGEGRFSNDGHLNAIKKVCGFNDIW